jgi:hypothetical protein
MQKGLPHLFLSYTYTTGIAIRPSYFHDELSAAGAKIDKKPCEKEVHGLYFSSRLLRL